MISNVLFGLQLRGYNSKNWFIYTLRALSGQPTPFQALVMITKTTEFIDVQMIGITFTFKT